MKTDNTTHITFFYDDGNVANEIEYDVLIPNLYVGDVICYDDIFAGIISSIKTNICKEDGILYVFQSIDVNI